MDVFRSHVRCCLEEDIEKDLVIPGEKPDSVKGSKLRTKEKQESRDFTHMVDLGASQEMYR